MDSPYNIPLDAAEWQSGQTYNEGDIVHNGPPQYFLRLCERDGVTAAPDFSTKNLSTADWRYLDPHTDLDQPSGMNADSPNEQYGNVFMRDMNNRRYPGVQINRGVVNALRFQANNNSGHLFPDIYVHHNIFPQEVDGDANNPSVQPPFAASDMRSGATCRVENNWGGPDLLPSNIGIYSWATDIGNDRTYTYPTATAAITDVSTAYSPGHLAYEFSTDRSGWMRVVVTGSATAMTATEIKNARESDAGVLAIFEVDAYQNTTATGGFAGTFPAGSHAHGLFQAGAGNYTVVPAQPIITGTVNAFTLDQLDFDGYVFDGTGQGGTAPVILTGTGAAGAEVQIRGTSGAGDTSWVSGFVGQNGLWSITMNVPEAEWGNWYTPQAREGSAGAPVSGTNTFGCGHVLGVFGQSELVHWLTSEAFRNVQTKELAAENLTVILARLDDGSDITTSRITAANLVDANVGSLALVNAMHHILGDERKFMIVDLAHQGTTPVSLWNDADTARRWDTFAAVVAKARASGSDLGCIIQNWWGSPAASLPTMLQDWAPGMFGQLASGAAFTLGNNNTEGVSFTVGVDHCLWDIEAPEAERGRGLFARARTKLYVMGPIRFNDVTGSNTAFPENLRVANSSRAGVETFVADSRVQTFLAAYGPGTHMACFDEFDTGTDQVTHPNRADPIGIPWFANQHIPAFLHAAGQPVGEPEITAINQVNSTTVDLTVSLPNGGVLTTLAGLGVGNHPGTTTAANIPHLQDVIGFQIDRAGGTKRPIFNSQSGENAAYIGTVTIQDAANGIVRIVMQQAFASGDQLTFLDGQANAVLDGNRDEAARLFNFMPLEHVAAWSDGAALYPYHGVPVKPQPVIAAL